MTTVFRSKKQQIPQRNFVNSAVHGGKILRQAAGAPDFGAVHLR
jgi:hypothetical protein